MEIYSWINTGQGVIEKGLSYDLVSVSLNQQVMTVTSLVKIYSYEYKGGARRFKLQQGKFSLSKLLKQQGNNKVIQFKGREKVGQVSYLQVKYWNTRLRANGAAKKAQFMNKVGDFAQKVGIVQSQTIVGDTSKGVKGSVGYKKGEEGQTKQLIALLVGASAKSAQQQQHSWQPSAKEGPTPVSAQLHSATKVTAGIYQKIRVSPLIERESRVSMVMVQQGGQTAQLGAGTAQVSNDLKRVIAFSTSSQLGYKMVCCGISQYSLAQFHLINHAFFKGLQFQAAGAVLHCQQDNQDIRKHGGTVVGKPQTYTVFQFGSQSQKAVPFTAGFYSKDYKQGKLLIPVNTTNSKGYVLTKQAAVQTGQYSKRLKKLSFYSSPRYSGAIQRGYWGGVGEVGSKDSGGAKSFPLRVQGVKGIISGYKGQYLFQNKGGENYYKSQFSHPAHNIIQNGELGCYPYTELGFDWTRLKVQPLQLLKQFILVYVKVGKDVGVRGVGVRGVGVRVGVFGVFGLYDVVLYYQYRGYYRASSVKLRMKDRGLLEQVGPYGLKRGVHYKGFKVEKTSTGYQQHYVYQAQVQQSTQGLVLIAPRSVVRCKVQVVFYGVS